MERAPGTAQTFTSTNWFLHGGGWISKGRKLESTEDINPSRLTRSPWEKAMGGMEKGQ